MRTANRRKRTGQAEKSQTTVSRSRLWITKAVITGLDVVLFSNEAWTVQKNTHLDVIERTTREVVAVLLFEADPSPNVIHTGEVESGSVSAGDVLVIPSGTEGFRGVNGIVAGPGYRMLQDA